MYNICILFLIFICMEKKKKKHSYGDNNYNHSYISFYIQLLLKLIFSLIKRGLVSVFLFCLNIFMQPGRPWLE